MHVHSKQSDDAGGTVEGYLKWIGVLRKKGYRLDGVVLTEHRGFDFDIDYSEIANQYDVLVLKGAEVETDLGHVLLYGITEALTNQFDLTNIHLPAYEVFRAMQQTGGSAVAAHPGRTTIGLCEYMASGATIDCIDTVESLNGGSNEAENNLANQFAAQYGLKSIGGSDSHYVSSIGKCSTYFYNNINSIEDMVNELRSGQFHPVGIDDTRSN